VTKKDYIMLAKIIKITLGPIQNTACYFSFIGKLCSELRNDNERFDSEKFRNASRSIDNE